MARNAEKAMAMLSRWVAMKKNEKKFREKRPNDPLMCGDVWKGEKWRRDVIRDITLKVSQIQNAGLGEFRIRDLNDEINRLIKEKERWEDRIRELGGPDYSESNPKLLDADGKELPSNRGYKYFGAARDLPGVKELFDHEPPQEARKTNWDLQQRVDADYYGYRDEDDGVIVSLEHEVETRARAAAVDRWREGIVDGMAKEFETELFVPSDDDDPFPLFNKEEIPVEITSTHVGPELDTTASIVVPTQQQVESMLVEHKRKDLLKRYVSETLSAQHEESKALMGL